MQEVADINDRRELFSDNLFVHDGDGDGDGDVLCEE
jgi:hypothetical protein